jgi:hypothetical protein
MLLFLQTLRLPAHCSNGKLERWPPARSACRWQQFRKTSLKSGCLQLAPLVCGTSFKLKIEIYPVKPDLNNPLGKQFKYGAFVEQLHSTPHCN